MSQAFSDEDCEAVLLVDASNAFNALNLQAALRNIRALCPSMATALINTYRRDAELYVDGTSLHSQEGTTQGDPLAMPMYALAVLPLIKKVNPDQSVIQSWYADDASAAGSILNLREWWNALDPLPTPSSGTQNDVKITSDGKPHLGAALGTSSFTKLYVKSKVERCQKSLTNSPQSPRPTHRLPMLASCTAL